MDCCLRSLPANSLLPCYQCSSMVAQAHLPVAHIQRAMGWGFTVALAGTQSWQGLCVWHVRVAARPCAHRTTSHVGV